MAAAILSLTLTKCPHFAGLKCLNSFPHATTMEGIWRKFHPAPEKGTRMTAIGQTVEGKTQTYRQTADVIDACISDDYEYTCGSVLLPPSNPHHKTILCRPEICCETPIQLPYYASGLGKSDLCCYCASEDGEVDQLLKAKYKTVLPLCASCKEKGKNPVVQRPYGIKKK